MTTPREQSKNRKKILATDVVRLSQLFTRERERLPAAYLKDPGSGKLTGPTSSLRT